MVTRRSRCRRGPAGAVIVVALLAGSIPAGAYDRVNPGSVFCEGGDPARGDGSTSQRAVHTRIFAKAFAKACRKEAGLVTYLGTGTRRGIAGLMARRLPFAGSDVPLSTAEWLLMHKGDYTWSSPVHQIPLYVETWAVAYNIPCKGPQLRLRSAVLGHMYSGRITRWDDPLLRTGGTNAWLETCSAPIRLARRVDEAASSGALQDYLAKRNPQWVPYRRGVMPTRWPTSAFACSGLGDDGMSNCIRSFRGSIGYLGLTAARANRFKVAAIENISGSFVPPSAAGCTTAASTAVPPPGTSPIALPGGGESPWVPATLGDWSTVSISDAPDAPDGSASYPICSFSYVIALQNWLQGYSAFMSSAVLRAVVDYLLIALSTPAQRQLTTAGHARLPENMRRISLDGVRSMSFIYFTTGPV